MPEETPETGTPVAPEAAPETGKPEPDWKAEAEKWKALSQKNEQKAKANHEALEAKVKALEPLTQLATALGVKPENDKTDLQVLTERVTAQERRAAEAELKALRLEVAAEAGLSPAQAKRLTGTTREELTADAAELKALFPPQNGQPGTPAPDPSQGARGGGIDREALIREAQAKGDYREVIRLQNEKLAGVKPA